MGNGINSLGEFEKSPQKEALLNRLSQTVEVNLRNEQFGVEELADQMSMSRSNLHRKLKRATGQSVSRFIREYRLYRAMEILKKEDKTIAEVSYLVGFGSSSYFTTCFTKYYGYPPSEVKYNIEEQEIDTDNKITEQLLQKAKKNNRLSIGSFVVVSLIIVFIVFRYFNNISKNDMIGDKSIVVLPFKNLNSNKENEYFSAGVVGTITSSLSQIDDLKVTSPNTAQKYLNSNKSDKEISNELKVSYLLQGSIQRDQGKIQIKVYLIDANNDQQIWAKSYDREFKNILEIQSDIAEEVALALSTELSSGEILMLGNIGTDNAEAYDLYLKGMYQNGMYTNNGFHNGIDFFEQAIALDSSYANAYSGLALCHMGRASIFSSELSAKDAFAIAKPFIDKALILNPKLVQAHASMGFYFLYNNWDFKKAEKEYKKAIATDDPDALALYADFLNFTKRHDEALNISNKLNSIHPHYPNSRIILSLYYLGRYEEATKFSQSRMASLKSSFILDSYGFLMLNTENFHEAIQLFNQGIDLQKIRTPRLLGWVGAAYAKSGQEKIALELIVELKVKKSSTDAGSPAFFIAVIYAALDEKEEALKWLEIAYKDHEMEMPWLISEPQFYSLQNEPVFQTLQNKIGFP